MTWRAFIQLLVSLLGLAGVQADNLPPIASGVSRRAFLKTLGLSAAALAALPDALALDEPLDLDDALGGGVNLSDLNGLFKDLYAPLIAEQLNAPNTLLRFMSKPAPATMPPWLTGPNHYAQESQ